MPDHDDPHSMEASIAERGDGAPNPPGRLLSVALGGLVGIPIGAVFGAATYYMLNRWEELPTGVFVGALAGPVIGAFVVAFEHLIRGAKVQVAIATRVGIVIGLVPTIFALTKLGPGVRPFLLIGAVFIGPAIGLMIGAFFDRAIDEWRNRSKSTSLLFAALGIIFCSMLIWWVDLSAQSGSKEEVEKAVWTAVNGEWSHDAVMRDAIMTDIVVERDGRRSFAGTFNATLDGATIPNEFNARIVGDKILIEWQSQNE